MSANVSRSEKKEEAIKRMKMIGLFEPAIEAFEKEDLVMVSEPPIGGLYSIDDDDELVAIVKEVEELYDALVYVVIRSFTNFGCMDSLLYVSDYPSEWSMDIDDLKDGYAVAYVYNHDMPDCSEFGSIVFERVSSAGLIRCF